MHSYDPWICSIVGSILIGLSGIFPLAFISLLQENFRSEKKDTQSHLKLFISFTIGSLLGDVFLHLLPESWRYLQSKKNVMEEDYIYMGFWIIIGLLSFNIIEKIGIAKESLYIEEKLGISISDSSENLYISCDNLSKTKAILAGYLNIAANSFDNFSHGLAIAASFLVSFHTGVLTTITILIHEIPHEVGDVAILLRAGFCTKKAAKMQLITASIGMLGAAVALKWESNQTLGEKTWWILPFTAGGFLNIALINLLPDFLKETDPLCSVKQMLWLFSGIIVIGGLTLLPAI